MATYLIIPDFQGTAAGEMVAPMDGYSIPIAARVYVNDFSVEYANKFLTKRTGFESVRHTVDLPSGTDILATLDVNFTGDCPAWLFNQLRALAVGISGAGLRVSFNDDWADNMQYTGVWTNAGDFVESFEGMFGASFQMQVFSVAAL